MANLSTVDISTLNGETIVTPLDNFSTIGVLISGTWNGTLTFQGSQDGVDFVNIQAQNINTRVLTSTTSSNGQFIANSAGLKAVKVIMTTYISGVATLLLNGNGAPSGITRSSSTLVDSSGSNFGVISNPIVFSGSVVSPELSSGKLYSAAIEMVASAGNEDNPLLLLRNPINSSKTLSISKIIVGTVVTNVSTVFKLFSQPTLSNTISTITNITQIGLSNTVTVTTSAANGASVGATVTITGTSDFNGNYTVTSITSPTVYVFLRGANLFTQINNSGTSTMNSSLGSVMTTNPLKIVSAPIASVALVNSNPIVGNNGKLILAAAMGQNTTFHNLMESSQVSIEPGQNLLITGKPSSNNRAVTVTIIWSEA